MGRTIIIGDIHGCYQEFQDLLEKVKFEPKLDQLLLVGDLINRGPHSKDVFLLSQKLKAKVVLGNHEQHLLNHSLGQGPKKHWIQNLKEEFGEHYPFLIQTLKTWPYHIETEDFLLVHGGISPIQAPAETDPKILISIRTWDGLGKDLQSRSNPPWFEFYQGSKLVVFGHWAALEGVVRKNAIGLDTGCVYGKRLSALVLPEREIISVPAYSVHCPI